MPAAGWARGLSRSPMPTVYWRKTQPACPPGPQTIPDRPQRRGERTTDSAVRWSGPEQGIASCRHVSTDVPGPRGGTGASPGLPERGCTSTGAVPRDPVPRERRSLTRRPAHGAFRGVRARSPLGSSTPLDLCWLHCEGAEHPPPLQAARWSRPVFTANPAATWRPSGLW
jgi:hypothetical protein